MVRVNMVTALDGHIVGADGVSGTLGGDGDRQAFSALRHLADGIVAGAGTVRAEDYGGMKLSSSLRERREADGRTDPAPVVIVTRSLRLDPSARVFTDTSVAPFVLTTSDADPDLLARVREAGAQVVQAGEGDVDLVAGVRALREEHGLSHLLCEGGPTLNGQLLTAGLVDEVCLTLAPTLAGGQDHKRIVDGLASRHDLLLHTVLQHEGELLLRYTSQNRRSSSDSMPRSAS